MPLQFRRPQFVIVASATMASVIGSMMMVMPLFAKERLGAGPTLLGSYGFCFSISYVITCYFSGAICRRFGFRWAITAGLLPMIGATVAALAIRDKHLMVLPFLLAGLGCGVFWPSIEGANAEEQSARQIKRGIAFFNYSWGVGGTLGLFIAGWLYELDGGRGVAPFVCNLGALTGILGLIAVRRFFEIAQWRAAAEEVEHAPVERRRLFARLGLAANFGMVMALMSMRNLLPEYASTVGLTGFNYGLLLSLGTLGALTGNAALSRWHGWHYSGRFLIGAQLVGVGALLCFTFTDLYAALCVSLALVGVMMQVAFFSSIYYGMELLEDKGEHGRRHELSCGLACGVAPLLGGIIIAVTDWPRSAFFAYACIILVSAIVQTAILLRAGSPGATRRTAMAHKTA